MKTFDDEMIQKARNAKSAEELLAFANDDNYKMTAEEANIYYAQLNPKGGELSDNELDNVSGGGCSTSITVFYDDGMIGNGRIIPHREILTQSWDLAPTIPRKRLSEISIPATKAMHRLRFW